MKFYHADIRIWFKPPIHLPFRAVKQEDIEYIRLTKQIYNKELVSHYNEVVRISSNKSYEYDIISREDMTPMQTYSAYGSASSIYLNIYLRQRILPVISY